MRLKFKAGVKVVFIHCSDTEDGPKKDFNSILVYHVKKRKMRTIAYHELIEEVYGSIMNFHGRGWNEKGAHTYGYNEDTLGVCVVGDFDIMPPDKQHIDKLYEVLDRMQKVYGEIEVHGHCEVSTKTCPGLMFPLAEVKAKYNGKKYNKLDAPPEWLAPFVDEMHDYGISLSDARYADNITRGEVVVIIVKILKAVERLICKVIKED